MKTTPFKYIIALFFVLATTVSCNKDYLELEPIDKPSDSNFLKNEQELALAVTGAYNPLWFEVFGIPFNLWLDNISDIGWDRNNEGNLYSKGIYDSQSPVFSQTWTNYYQGISRCNFILDNLDRGKGTINTKLLTRSEGEIRFLRAYYYQILTELYGDVPLITTTQKLEDSFVKKNLKAEVVKFILDELNYAQSVLPAKYTGSDVGRVTSGAALSLISRVALYNGQWQAAIDAAQKVMSANTYSLFPNYRTLFQYPGEQSSEVIFDIQYQQEANRFSVRAFYSRNGGGFINKIPLQALVDRYETVDGLRIDKSPLYNPAKPFLNRDPRLDATIVRPGSIFLGYQYEVHPDSLKVTNFNTNPASRVNNLDTTNPFASFSGYGWRKYIDDKDLVDRQTEMNLIVIRYAEVLLTYAEAKIESGQIDQSVYDAINKVRQRPTVKMPPIAAGKDKDELRKIVRRERLVELAGEGFRLSDIRRWKIAENVMNATIYGRILKGGYELMGIPVFGENEKPDFSKYASIFRVIETRVFKPERDYYWPIPQKDIDVNTNLKQNPGY